MFYTLSELSWRDRERERERESKEKGNLKNERK